MEKQYKVMVAFTIHSPTTATVDVDGIGPAPAKVHVEIVDGMMTCRYFQPHEFTMQQKDYLGNLHEKSGEFVDSFMMGVEPVLKMQGLTLADCGVKVDCKVCCPDTVN